MFLAERSPRMSGGPTSGVSVRATAPVRQALLFARERIPFDVLRERLVEATGSGRPPSKIYLTPEYARNCICGRWPAREATVSEHRREAPQMCQPSAGCEHFHLLQLENACADKRHYVNLAMAY